jgi:hypothetical protein
MTMHEKFQDFDLGLGCLSFLEQFLFPSTCLLTLFTDDCC